jgi:aspartyl-tRNA(Asn)/glutamyl-tRNA(Gln) amidotransferase subunit A
MVKNAIDVVEKVENCIKAIEKDNKKGRHINAILQLNENVLEEARVVQRKIAEGKAGRLAGYVIAIKANINVKGLATSCASRVLEDYIAPYDATVVEKIRAEDGLIIGIANMDEFACGSSGETSAFGPTQNPVAYGLIPGGSSSGSAAAVAAGFCDLALGSDTGGSIRNPASHCGLVGLKPSYGLVSRYGLIDLAMSLDQIGPIAKNVNDAWLLFDVIKGQDERDATTLKAMPKLEKPEEQKQVKAKKIALAVPEVKVEKKIADLFREALEKVVKAYRWKAEQIRLKYLDLAVQTYYPICYVEFFSATRKFDGRRFGKRIEEYCGEEVLRRILGGSEISKEEYRGKYYRQALKVRALIKSELEKTFKSYDAIITPTVPKLPHKLGEKLSVEDMYNYDTLTVVANLAEIPCISLPCGYVDRIPVGLQIMMPVFSDYKLLWLAKKFEDVLKVC